MQLGYFQVMAEPVSTWVQEIFAWVPRQSPRLVTKLKMPPLPSLSPGYQFCTVEYLISASSSAMSSTTAACSWFSSRLGAVQPSRYDTWLPASAMIKVRSNWPVFAALMRKYVDSSIGQRTPLGTYTNEPSVKTAELRAAKKLSDVGTTVPRYCSISSGCFCTASENGQNTTPAAASRSLNVVATETLSNTASTATPASRARSWSGTPSFSYVSSSFGSTSSRLFGPSFLDLGAE